MIDTAARLDALRRPDILVSAARHGLNEAPDRTRLLRRVLKGVRTPPIGSVQALALLLDREAELEAMRTGRDPVYTCAAHVEAVTALMMAARDAAPAIGR